MSTIIELKIDSDTMRSIQSRTEYNILQSIEIVSEIMEYFSEKEISLNREALINGNYLELSADDKDKIIVYFYWMHNRGKKTAEPGFVSLKLIHKYLDIRDSYENRYLREYIFTHTYPCPNCREAIKVKFKNLKIPEVVQTECPVCHHTLGNVISAGCSCESCRELISAVESYITNIPKQVELEVQTRYDEPIPPKAPPLSENRLRWFADKNSSDLTKDEREIISYQPVDVKELRDIAGTKAYTIVSKLKEKKVIYERYTLRKQEDVLSEIKKQISIRLNYTVGSGYSKISSYSNLNLYECDLSKAKVKYMLVKTNSYRGETHLEIVFENDSFQFNPGNFNSSQRDRYPRDKINVELYSMTLPQTFTFTSEAFYETSEVLNPYFFNLESIDGHPFYNEELVRPLFKSKVENNKYHFLRNKYRDSIIMVNVRLADVIDIKSLVPYYTEEELGYLRNCILDYVFYTKDGYPVEVLELQRGDHHNDDKYILKDKLKKSAVMMVGLGYKETF